MSRLSLDRKRFARTLSLLLLLFCISSPIQASGAEAGARKDEKKELRAYVLYDARFRFGSEQPTLVSLQEYLGHFDLEQRALSIRDWKPGSLHDADIVFFLGLTAEELPREMLGEIAKAGRVVWFEQNIEQLAAFLGWRDFRCKGLEDGWLSVLTRIGERPMPSWMNCVVTSPGASSEIYGSVKNIGGQEALYWRRDNVYYLGCLDFFAPTMQAALVDILYRAIPPKYAGTYSRPKQVLLRVEDVSPLTAPDALRGVLDTIAGYGIPYAIGVISVGVLEDGSRAALHERPELVEILQRAQANGASIIMHGYSHENEFSPKTGEGWEFWNAKDDRPMADDEAFTRDRIEKAFLELARCGLYPVAFEPPHYAMSKKGYEVLSGYFNIFSGEVQTSDESYKISMTLPYITKSPYLGGMILLPENMGYYDGDEMRVENMLQSSAAILETNDPFACFFYHGYLTTTDPLREAIEGARRQGYSFFDLRSMPIRAASPQVKIAVENGRVSAWVDPAATAQWKAEDAKEKSRSTIAKLGWIQVCVLIVAIAAIVGLIVHLKRTAWRKYEVQ